MNETKSNWAHILTRQPVDYRFYLKAKEQYFAIMDRGIVIWAFMVKRYLNE